MSGGGVLRCARPDPGPAALSLEESGFFAAYTDKRVATARRLGTCAEDVRVSLTTASTRRCRYCGLGNVVYRHRQTRSADEGMTTFFHCEDCSRVWKV